MNRIEQCLIVAATGCALVVLGACTTDPSGKTLSAETSERVCQLTGDTDWLLRTPTTSKARHFSDFGALIWDTQWSTATDWHCSLETAGSTDRKLHQSQAIFLKASRLMTRSDG
jgi:hypothetical protein